MAGREGSGALQIVIDQVQGTNPLLQSQIDFIDTLFAPNQESSSLQSQLISIPEFVQHPAVMQLVGNLWETCVSQNISTPEESFALGMLASALIYEQLSAELQAKIGLLPRAKGCVEQQYQNFELCSAAEANMREAVDLDGIVFGINDAHERVMALKLYPGRKSAIVLSPIALRKGILVPNVLYEIADSRTRRAIETSLVTDASEIALTDETQVAVMRPMKREMREPLGRMIGSYFQKPELRHEVAWTDPHTGVRRNWDRYSLALRTRDGRD